MDEKIRHVSVCYDENIPNRKKMRRWSGDKEFKESFNVRPFTMMVNTVDLFHFQGRYIPPPIVEGDARWLALQEDKKYEAINNARKAKETEELNKEQDIRDALTVKFI